VPSVLATVAAQLALAGDVAAAVALASELEDALLAEPHPASRARVRIRDRSRPRRRLLSRMKEALPGDVTLRRLGLYGWARAG
jgi:hypothetical protein